MKKLVFACLIFMMAAVGRAENLNIRFADTEVVEAIRTIGIVAGVNIVVDDSVKGKVSAQLIDVNLDEALRTILAGKNATYFYTENGVIVTAVANAKYFAQGLNVYHPNHVFVKDIRDVVKGLFDDGQVVFDNDTNTIFLMGGEPETAKMQRILAALDRATKQVTLEAQIYAISREDMEKLGVNWDWDKIPQRESRTDGSSDEDNNEDRNYGGKFKFWRGYSFRFAATLDLLQTKGRAKLLATPKLIVVSGKEGKIFVGEKIPVQTERHDSGGRYESTDFLDVGVDMRFQPLISNDGKLVTLRTKLEVGTPTLVSELNNYKITSRGTETVVRILSGETMVIGGLINEEEQRTLQKVPVLSKIPLLGALFKHRTNIKNKVEVIMLLTPYVNEAGDAPTIFDMEQAKKSIFDEKMR